MKRDWEVSGAVHDRGVSQVGIVGRSYGGGSTFILANGLENNRAKIGTFTIAFTGYIDAVVRGSTGTPETRRPPEVSFHLNIFERYSSWPHGDHTDNLEPQDKEYEYTGISHRDIDNNQSVHSRGPSSSTPVAIISLPPPRGT